MSVLTVLVGAGFAAWITYIAVLVRQASDRVDTVLPTRNPGESFGDWADNALAVFDDEHTARLIADDRQKDIARTATWIEFMTVDQFNAAVVRHLDTFPR